LRPKLIHVTTVDLSLDALLGYQLVRFQGEGFDVVGVSAPGPYVAGLERSGIRHVPVPSLTRAWTPEDDLRATAELVRVFRRERPAVVHTHNPKSGVLGRVAARIAKVPVIVNTVHGLYANPALSPGKRWVVDRAEAWAMRLSHQELFQSHEDLERALRERMVPPQRASWLGNGVDLRRFDPAVIPPEATRELRRKWEVDPTAPIVGAVGRLVREKGYLELFEAASEVRRVHPSVAFVVVGPSEPTKGDGLSASELEVAKRAGVVVAGEGDRKDMPSIYAAFDVFVLPSHREGMPRSLIEASAMQRPVVATEIRGCREVVESDRTGILVPPRNPRALAGAIEQLLADPRRAEAMGREGRARAIDRFDEDAVVERTVQTYRRLLRRHAIRWDGEAPAR
jgi:glycosyltransferase involved in cell wall biosynthesis